MSSSKNMKLEGLGSPGKQFMDPKDQKLEARSLWEASWRDWEALGGSFRTPQISNWKGGTVLV